jgi:hypothetical protein
MRTPFDSDAGAVKPPPIDRRVSISIGVHRGKDGQPALSIGDAGSNVTRIVRRKPKKDPPPEK